MSDVPLLLHENQARLLLNASTTEIEAAKITPQPLPRELSRHLLRSGYGFVSYMIIRPIPQQTAPQNCTTTETDTDENR